MGSGSVRPGETYRTLCALKGEGLVCKERDAEYPLSRRRYMITAPGEAYLELLADAPGRYRGEVERASLQEVSG